MRRSHGKLSLKKTPKPSPDSLFGLLILDISFEGGKTSHSPIMNKAWERDCTTVILINPMVVVCKLDFASETHGELVKTQISGLP